MLINLLGKEENFALCGNIAACPCRVNYSIWFFHVTSTSVQQFNIEFCLLMFGGKLAKGGVTRLFPFPLLQLFEHRFWESGSPLENTQHRQRVCVKCAATAHCRKKDTRDIPVQRKTKRQLSVKCILKRTRHRKKSCFALAGKETQTRNHSRLKTVRYCQNKVCYLGSNNVKETHISSEGSYVSSFYIICKIFKSRDFWVVDK